MIFSVHKIKPLAFTHNNITSLGVYFLCARFCLFNIYKNYVLLKMSKLLTDRQNKQLGNILKLAPLKQFLILFYLKCKISLNDKLIKIKYVVTYYTIIKYKNIFSNKSMVSFAPVRNDRTKFYRSQTSTIETFLKTIVIHTLVFQKGLKHPPDNEIT